MNWNVTYRNKDGRQDVIQIEAEDRAGVFSELSKRGIFAIKVEEAKGMAKPKPRKAGGNASTSGLFKGLLAGLLTVIGAIAAFVYLSYSNISDEPHKEKRRGKISESQPSIPKATADHSSQKGTEASLTHTTDRGGLDVSDVQDDASDDYYEEEDQRPPRPESALKTGSDQLISMATSMPPDVPIPPLPVISDSETDRFIESLNTPIEINDDDPEHVRKVKEDVQNVRMEIAKIMRENPDATLSQILNDHRDIVNHHTACRADVVNEINALIEDGDIEGARHFRDMMNMALQQVGVPEVTTPITPEERAEAGEDDEDFEEE